MNGNAPEDSSRNELDWDKFGLANNDINDRSGSLHFVAPPVRDNNAEFLYQTETKGEVKELFEEEKEISNHEEPWWKSNFFITRTVLFGTWDGVFTSCLINIIGVVIFLRGGWMIAYAGIGLTTLIIFISCLIALATCMSAVGIGDRCHMGSGGVYFIIAHVLGGRFGGTMGLFYTIGHAAAVALYCTGLAESFVQQVQWDSKWAVRGIALTVLLALLVVAVSGVKWVIRFQLLLVAILLVAMLDFVMGSLLHSNASIGFIGFSASNLHENAKPMLTSSVGFFTVLGVFFPTACGVMSGINMSGDLKEPSKNIPQGSLAALGVSSFLYMAIVLILGATCTRHTLMTNFMIMEKVSLIGALFLLGLYVSSLSSALGGLVGPPRVFQCICKQDILPFLRIFAITRGVNDEPLNATILIALVATGFIFIGGLNALAPIVTMPFLLTYASINYAYFAIAMSYDLKQKKKLDESYQKEMKLKVDGIQVNGRRKLSSTSAEKQGLLKESNGYGADNEAEHEHTQDDNHIEWVSEKEPSAIYAKVCNRWVSFVMAIVCVLLMFCIHWKYALISFVISLLLYVIIGHFSPGLSPGVAEEFSFYKWMKSPWTKRSLRKQQQRVVFGNTSFPCGISMYQITDENADYANRDKKHHSATIKQPAPYD